MRARWNLSELVERIKYKLGFGEEDYLDDPAPEARETLLPRIVEPPLRSSSTARLALLMSTLTVAAIVYFNVPQVRDWLDSNLGIGRFASHRAPTADQAARREGRPDPQKVTLNDPFDDRDTAATIIDWAGKVNASLSTAQRMAEVDTVHGVLLDRIRREVAAHPNLLHKREGSDQQPTVWVSNCCMAGDAHKPHLIVCIEGEDLSENMVFAVRRSRDSHGVQRIDDSCPTHLGDGQRCSVTPRGADFDGDSVQELVLVYSVEDPFFQVTVRRLDTKTGRFSRVMSYHTNEGGSASLVREPGRLTRLKIMDGSEYYGEMGGGPRHCSEYAWNGRTLAVAREYYENPRD